MDDEIRVVDDLRKGRREAFSFIYEKYYRPVKSYVSRFLGNRDAGEDITQEVFIKLYKNIQSLRTPNLKNWLYTVAHNETINHIKRKKETHSSLEDEEPFCEDITTINIEAKHQRELIKAILLKLPKNQATALYLRQIEGRDYREISKHMGLSYEAVRVLIFRGRQNFIKYYEELSGDEL